MDSIDWFLYLREMACSFSGLSTLADAPLLDLEGLELQN